MDGVAGATDHTKQCTYVAERGRMDRKQCTFERARIHKAVVCVYDCLKIDISTYELKRSYVEAEKLLMTPLFTRIALRRHPKSPGNAFDLFLLNLFKYSIFSIYSNI